MLTSTGHLSHGGICCLGRSGPWGAAKEVWGHPPVVPMHLHSGRALIGPCPHPSPLGRAPCSRGRECFANCVSSRPGQSPRGSKRWAPGTGPRLAETPAVPAPPEPGEGLPVTPPDSPGSARHLRAERPGQPSQDSRPSGCLGQKPRPLGKGLRHWRATLQRGRDLKTKRSGGRRAGIQASP